MFNSHPPAFGSDGTKPDCSILERPLIINTSFMKGPHLSLCVKFLVMNMEQLKCVHSYKPVFFLQI